MGYHTFLISRALKFGFFLFLLRELMFFFRVFWFFFDSSIVPRVDLGET
ncbi:MAG: cytochrome c oxidase subunit 3 [Candidatus Nitrosocosmicus sp.]